MARPPHPPRDLRAAEERAFDRYYASAFGVLVDRVGALLDGDHATAHASVQQAFVHAWAERRRFADAPDPDAWVCARALRLAGRRRRGRRRPLCGRSEAPVPSAG
jgi:DNA-directed RNA polymerase specialized sigma24 family protein